MKFTLLAIFTTFLTSLSLIAGSTEDATIIVTCEGRITEYGENAGHVSFGRKRPCRWFDIVSIEILSPTEWQGHVLKVHTNQLKPTSPLKQKERKIKFKIPKLYLVKDYSNPDGTSNTYIPGLGALEQVSTEE